MSFPFNLYAGGFLVALACSAGLFPLWRGWCVKTGHVDDPGHRKIHHTPTPLAGGLTVMSGFLLPILAGWVLIRFFHWTPGNEGTVREVLSYGLSRREWQLLAIVGGAVAMMLLGWLDDRYELSPAIKFSGQAIIALLVTFTGIRVTLFIPAPWLNAVLTVLWILTVTNAFNFTDNMNGLCTGLGITSTWSCAWAAAIHGQFLVAVFGFLICGALLGFFPFNFPKASSFLGDSGSHLVGFLAAVLSILPNFYSMETPNRLAVLSPLFFLAVPLLDLVCVVIYRTRMGKPFYIGDTNHFSHRLVRAGFTRSHAVLILLVANAASGYLPFLFFYR